jgi:ribokinase
MTKIVVVGSLNMDLVVQVPEIPKPGETVLGSNFGAFPGGKGANQAVAAARLGAAVTMIGQVGDDSYGKTLVANLASEGVNTEYIYIDGNNATGVAMITVDERGQNSIAVASGANYSLTAEHIQSAWEKIGEIDILIMPLETPIETICEAAKLAKDQNVRVVLNPAPARSLDPDLLSMVDILIPNEHEVLQIAEYIDNSDLSIEESAKVLINRGVNTVVITLGENGVMIVDKKLGVMTIPSIKVDVLDTTAAGDSFVGALAVGLVEGKSLSDACSFANAAGAITVTRMGAQPSLPTRREINEFLDHQKDQL